MNITKTRSPSRAPIAVLLAAAMAVVGLALTAPVAAAESPHLVDPAAMQPQLNPDLAPWTCFETGEGITCKGGYQTTYAGPFGLQCDGKEVYVRGYGQEQATRWHTADGLATKTISQASFPEDVFTLSPTGEGPSLTIASHWNRHYTYAVPGDRDSRTLTELGLIYRATSADGVVLRDVGQVTFEPGQELETAASMHGIHDFYSDTSIIDRLICDTLT
jgi:hypothetical protein